MAKGLPALYVESMPFIPLHDANPRLYIRAHYVTIGLILLNLLVFLYTLRLAELGLAANIYGYTLVPARLLEGAAVPAGLPGIGSIFTLISYQFLHGGWAHLIFNMLFLWVFGDNIEDALGHMRFIAFFLICGIAGGLAHAVVEPQSIQPTIGASGAVSGILGGYVMLYPRSRLLVLVFRFIPLRLPAVLVIGAFLAQNLFWGLTGSEELQRIAVWSHIGGFVTGAALVIILKRAHIPLWHRPPRPWN